jgi:hypothetical protein
MRSFRHWTPRYIKNRLTDFYYEKTHPSQPWLTRTANEILDSYLKKTDVGLEFGSGRSTLWIAKRIAHLTSVEDNDAWAANVLKMLTQAGLANVDYRFFPIDSSDARASKYVKVADEFADTSLDFCLVDGTLREYCTLKVVDKIRPGGLLVIDDVQRYLPSTSFSPSSRSLTAGADGPIWQEVERRIADWRRIWTSSGTRDTALFFKPC